MRNHISVFTIIWKQFSSIDQINVSCSYNTEAYFEFYLHFLVNFITHKQAPSYFGWPKNTILRNLQVVIILGSPNLT